MIRVFIADLFPIVREGLRRIASSTSDIRVVGEADTMPATRRDVAAGTVDVLVLDSNLPGDAFELIADLKRRLPRTVVLLLSREPDIPIAIRAMRSGAAGFVTKVARPEELVRAIRKVATGAVFLTDEMSEALAVRLVQRTESDRPDQRLSNREFQVLRLIAAGRTARQIGDELGLSVKTVGTYRGRLLQKMEMKTNAQLIAYALKSGLVV